MGPETYTSFEMKNKKDFGAYRLQKHTINESKRNRFDEAKKLGLKELQRSMYGQESPGCIYDVEQAVKALETKKGFSFGRISSNNRELHVIQEQSMKKSPKTERRDLSVDRAKNAAGSFGRAKRQLDLENVAGKMYDGM